jgi:hypothetical protein
MFLGIAMEPIINEKRYKDNPNPKAEIGLVISYPFQYYVYKDIYKHLDKSEFIIDLGAFYPKVQPEELVGNIVELLRKNKAAYRILYYSDYNFVGYLREFFSKYKALVCVWERGCIRLNCNLNKIKINLTYGAGKELTQVRVHRKCHDLILAYGNRDSKLFSMYTEAKVVGNPKFDDWFNNNLDKNFLEEIESDLRKEKKTVLYLPTHGDLCSIDFLEEELKKLTSKYNVIAKIHYFTIREEPGLMERLKKSGIVIYGDNADLLPLLKVSDVVISDNSSAIFDAILADRPLVVTDFISDKYLDIDHKRLKQTSRGPMGALTYSGSIEQEIKKKGQVITIKSSEDLAKGVKKAILDEDFYKKSRKDIGRELFAYHDGKCGERAAQAINEVMSRDRPKERPIMFHAIEAYLCEIPELRRLAHVQRKLDQKRFEQCEEFLSRNIMEGKKASFSVIIIDSGGKFLKSCLESLIWQEFPRDCFEIIVATFRSEGELEDIRGNIHGENELLSQMQIVSLEKGMTMGHGIKKCIQRAKGDYFCFIRSQCAAHSKWIFDISLAFQKYPFIVGVGGYEINLKKNYSLLDEFLTQEVGRVLGCYKEPDYNTHFYEVKNNLFYRNPAGSLSNMAYKKDFVIRNGDVFDDPSLGYSELELKRRALNEGELLFSPFPITKMEKTTWKKFREMNFDKGFAYHRLCDNRPELKSYYGISFFSPVRFALLNILDGSPFKKITSSAIVFCGFFFRWLGGRHRKPTYLLPKKKLLHRNS